MKYIKLFEEVELNLTELTKPSKAGKLRGDVLINKIEKGEELTTNTNKKIIIDKVKNINGEYVDPVIALTDLKKDDGSYSTASAPTFFSQKNRYKNVFKSGDLEFQLNQIKKTKDFGSSGAGITTQKYEILQCIFLAVKLLYPRIELTYTSVISFLENNTNIIKRLNLHLPSTADSKDIINNIIDVITEIEFTDRNWLATFTRIPEKVYNTNVFVVKYKYSTYHVECKENDSPVNILKKKFTSFKKGTGSSVHFSKYCPADVYIVKTGSLLRVNNLIESATTMDGLTTLLDNLFDTGIFIPISLKKIFNDDNFRIITNRAKNKQLPEFFIQNFKITQDPTKGIGSKITTLSKWTSEIGNGSNGDIEQVIRNITIDSSNTTKKVNVDGEVEGSASRHGKISFLAIKKILNSGDTKYNIESYSDLSGNTIEELKIKIEELYSEMKRLSNYIGGIDVIELPNTKPFVNVKGVSKDRVIRYSNLETEGQLISKIQSLQILKAIGEIYKDDVDYANKLMTDIMSYALSIKTDLFNRTPRYLRVI